MHLGLQNKVVVREVPLSKKSISDTDVYILDLGLELYQVHCKSISDFVPITEFIFQYNGAKANKDEKFKAGGYVSKIKVS